MAVEMSIGFEFRIAVGRQHLTVGVDVDPFALGLLEEFLEVLEIVARDQDGLALPVSERHLGRHRVSVGSRVGGIQKLHGLEVDLAALEGQPHPVVEVQILPQHGGKGFMHVRKDAVVFLPQDLGMVRVGADSPQAEEHGMLQRQDIGIDGRIGFQPDLFSLGHQTLQGRSGCEGGGVLGKIGLAARRFHLGLQCLSQLHRTPDESCEIRRIEIDVGKGREQGFTGEHIDLAVTHPDFASLGRKEGQALHGMGQQILKCCNVWLFAADPDFDATFTFCRLFALVAKHGLPPLSGYADSFSNSLLGAPQRGQTQSSGKSSKGVPGAMPFSGSPSAGSYTY